jgi:hypothetical protein
MLATALDHHHSLRVAGEVLVRPERYDVRADTEAEGQPMLTIEDTWARYNGFINQRHHAPASWEYIAGLSDVVVISLKRRNVLAAFVSLKISESNNVWQHQQHDSLLLDAFLDDWAVYRYDAEHLVELDFEETDNAIKDMLALYESVDHQMMDFRHPLLEVWYEDLIRDWNHWMSVIQLYLCVEPMPLKAATCKQETRPLSQIISNYEEICEKARKAEDCGWRHMLKG